MNLIDSICLLIILLLTGWILWCKFKNNTGLFPSTIDEVWYCGKWYTYKSSCYDDNIPPRWPVEDQIMFNPYECGVAGFRGGTAPGLIDGLIPAIIIDGKIGLYELTKVEPPSNSFYDGAMWDDGHHAWFKFVKSVPLTDELEKQFCDHARAYAIDNMKMELA